MIFFFYFSKDVTEWKREIEPQDWLKTIKIFLDHPDCDRSVHCGIKHPIWFAAQTSMPMEVARYSVFHVYCNCKMSANWT